MITSNQDLETLPENRAEAVTVEIVEKPKGPESEEQKPKKPQRTLTVTSPMPIYDTGGFTHLQRIASIMAAGASLPMHLRGKLKKGEVVEWYKPETVIANCFRIAEFSERVGFSPYSVAEETYFVHGKMGFQGKLVMALVNTRAGLNGRLSYEFSGEGHSRTVTVKGTINGESEPRTVEVVYSKAATKNDAWKKDPDQKLCYTGAVKWARRHAPEVVMGVSTVEDLETQFDVDDVDRADSSPRMIGQSDVKDVLNGQVAPSQRVDGATGSAVLPDNKTTQVPAEESPEAGEATVVEPPDEEVVAEEEAVVEPPEPEVTKQDPAPVADPPKDDGPTAYEVLSNAILACEDKETIKRIRARVNTAIRSKAITKEEGELLKDAMLNAGQSS